MNKFLNICSAINLFQLHCRWMIKNFQAQMYLAIHSLYLAYQCKFASQILFNLFVLTVNLNLYCSWKTLRFEQIVCVVCAWSPWIMVIAAFAQNGYKLWQKNHFQHESSVFGPRLPRGQSKFSNENYATVWWKSKPFLPDFPWVFTEVYRFFSQIHLHYVCLTWITKRIYKYNAFCTRRKRRQF